MCVVAILDDCFSSGEALAERVAKQLGYRLVDQDVVIEGAAAWGFSRKELRDTLERPFTLLDGFQRKRHSLLAVIRAALAKEIRAGNVVCHGNTAHLLPTAVHHVLRARLTAPLEVRQKLAEDRLRLSQAEAISYIRQRDTAKQKWLRSLCAVNGSDPSPYYVAIDLGVVPIERASNLLSGIALLHSQFTRADTCPAALDQWVLSTLVKAEVALSPATRNVQVVVAADRGLVSLRGRLSDPNQLREIERVLMQVDGVTQVNLSEIEVGGPGFIFTPVVTPFGQESSGCPPKRRALWPAWLMMAVTLCAVIVYFSLVSKGVSSLSRVAFPSGVPQERVFAGIITDTMCGPSHKLTELKPEGQCVLACVKRDRKVKYALYDGTNLFVLSDQRTPEKFAARQVRVAGVLDENTRRLMVESIVPVL